MKKFDIKSIALGLVAGAAIVSTVFAANSIKSAAATNARLKIDGMPISLNSPIVSVQMEGEKDAKMYMPLRDVLEYLGHSVKWDGKENLIEVTTDDYPIINRITERSKSDSGTVIDLTSTNTSNIAASGFFNASSGQKLILEINAEITDGSVDFFLFDPSGKETRYTFAAGESTKEIQLSAGKWAYNCSGSFKKGGSVRVIGTLESK